MLTCIKSAASLQDAQDTQANPDGNHLKSILDCNKKNKWKEIYVNSIRTSIRVSKKTIQPFPAHLVTFWYSKTINWITTCAHQKLASCFAKAIHIKIGLRKHECHVFHEPQQTFILNSKASKYRNISKHFVAY